jgi:hypothetical protein
MHRTWTGWRACDQRGKPPQVLVDGRQNKLIVDVSWATQSQSI